MIKNIGNNLYKYSLVKSNSIEVRKAKYLGYGVFATKDIDEGTVIEECVVAEDILPRQNAAFPNYRFAGDGHDVMILGNACLLGHSLTPNCRIIQNMDYERVVRIVAIKRILTNEELTHIYNKELIL